MLDRVPVCLAVFAVYAINYANMIMQVFVAGASGSTGRKVVRELRKRGFTVRAGVRVSGA